MRGLALRVGLVVPVLLAVACGPQSTAPGTSPDASAGPSDEPERPDEPTAQGQARAWRHLARVEGLLEDGSAAMAIQKQAALDGAWASYGFKGAAPPVDFDHEVVLLLLQPDDACPDELIGLEVRDGELHPEWLPPPGGCNQPLIFRLHAVAVHRGHLPRRFGVALPEPYAAEAARAEIELAAYEGEAAPPPPTPPRAMTAAQLDAVFDGHAVRRCTPEDDAVPERTVDGPLSNDPEVAEAQQQRAGFGVPSDEQTTREVMADPDRTDEYGFPLLASELAQDQRASELVQDVIRYLEDQGLDPERDFVPMLGRDGGIRPRVLVPPDEVAARQADLDREFGRGEVDVRALRYDLREIQRAQRDLRPIMGGSGPGTIFSSTGAPGPVEIGMIDPTRDALDLVARTVDPALVCVHPELSGVSDFPR